MNALAVANCCSAQGKGTCKSYLDLLGKGHAQMHQVAQPFLTDRSICACPCLFPVLPLPIWNSAVNRNKQLQCLLGIVH